MYLTFIDPILAVLGQNCLCDYVIVWYKDFIAALSSFPARVETDVYKYLFRPGNSIVQLKNPDQSRNQKSHNHVQFQAKIAEIGSMKARYMMLVSTSIYSSRGIQWCIYKYPNITQSQSHKNMFHFDQKGLKLNLMFNDMILVCKIIYSVQWCI